MINLSWKFLNFRDKDFQRKSIEEKGGVPPSSWTGSRGPLKLKVLEGFIRKDKPRERLLKRARGDLNPRPTD